MVEMLGDFCGELMSLHDTCPGQEGCKDGVRLDSSIIAEKMKQHTLYICFLIDLSVFDNTVFNQEQFSENCSQHPKYIKMSNLWPGN